MTRVKISVGILLLMLGVSIFSGIWVNKRCGELISGVKQLEGIADSGDYESAAKLAEELDDQWEDFSVKASSFIKYDLLTEIGRDFAKISYLAESESQDLVTELRELRHLLALLSKSETDVLSNIL